jgi:hypothetical protein
MVIVRIRFDIKWLPCDAHRAHHHLVTPQRPQRAPKPHQ